MPARPLALSKFRAARMAAHMAAPVAAPRATRIASRIAATLVTAALIGTVATIAAPNAVAADKSARADVPPPKVSFNQDFIQGLETKVDVDNPDTVFALIFRNLPDKVTVYPTENYFYWSFTANGRIYWGNYRLDTSDRDQGVVHLGYFEYDENGRFQDYDGWEKDMTAKDGVVLKKVSRFVYTMTYKGRTVTFQLNDVGMHPPKKGKLRADEVYVGPVFDESGIKFHLIFNTAEKFFLYVANDDQGPGETYRKLKSDTSVLVGRRTGFAYYDDVANGRKILVAINSWNARRNNYYDGPFDQLPDNYVDQTNIKKYIELAYPHLKGRINKFGHVLGEKGSRVAINAYSYYNDEAELDFVASCRKTYPGAPSAKFYACIAPDQEREPADGPGPGPNPRTDPGTSPGTGPKSPIKKP